MTLKILSHTANFDRIGLNQMVKCRQKFLVELHYSAKKELILAQWVSRNRKKIGSKISISSATYFMIDSRSKLTRHWLHVTGASRCMVLIICWMENDYKRGSDTSPLLIWEFGCRVSFLENKSWHTIVMAQTARLSSLDGPCTVKSSAFEI